MNHRMVPPGAKAMEYFEIERRAALSWELAAAEVGAYEAAQRLGLSDIGVYFYVGREDPRRTHEAFGFFGPLWLQGFTYPVLTPDAVMVRVGNATGRQIAETAAHEVRHLWQERIQMPNALDHEPDARAFAALVARDLNIPDHERSTR